MTYLKLNFEIEFLEIKLFDLLTMFKQIFNGIVSNTQHTLKLFQVLLTSD